MGVRITDFKLYNQLRNGERFNKFNTDYHGALVATPLERVQAKYTLNVSIYALFDKEVNGQQISWYSNNSSLIRIERNAGSFLDDDFWVGDMINIATIGNMNKIAGPLIITSIDPDQNGNPGRIMEFTNPAGVSTQTPSDKVLIYADSIFRGFEMNYGLIENDEGFNTISKIDGLNQGYFAAQSVTTSDQKCIRKPGPISGSTNDSVYVKHIGKSTLSLPYGVEQLYEVRHEFNVVPLYLDGESQNLDSLIEPELYSNGKSLKYVLDARFKVTKNDPNTKIHGKLANFKGNVVYINRSLDGVANYSIDMVNYTDVQSGSSVNSLQINKPTAVKFEISAVSGSFSSTGRVVINLKKLAAESDYRPDANNSNSSIIVAGTVFDNFVWEQVVVPINGPNSINQGFVKNCQCNLLANGKLQVSFIVDYNILQAQKLSSQDEYIIGVLVGNHLTPNMGSDRMLLKVDKQYYQESADIEDLLVVEKMEFFPPFKDPDNDSGFTDVKMPVESGLVAKVEFGLLEGPANNTNSDQVFAHLTSLSFDISMFNNVGKQIKAIESIQIPLSPNYDLDGMKLYDLGSSNNPSSRNFILKEDSKFNVLELYNEGGKFQRKSFGLNPVLKTYRRYVLKLGFKLPWEEWTSLNADSIFFNPNQLHNGLNRYTPNYCQKVLPDGITPNPFKVVGCLTARVLVSNPSSENYGKQTDYAYLSPELEVLPYDYSTDWTVKIETFRSDGTTSLNGSIADNEDTYVVATYTHSSGSTIGLLPTVYGINRLNIAGGNQFSISECSTIEEPKQGDKLKPLPGEGKANFLNTGTAIKITSVIDSSKINSNALYDISSSLGCPNSRS